MPQIIKCPTNFFSKFHIKKSDFSDIPKSLSFAHWFYSWKAETGTYRFRSEMGSASCRVMCFDVTDRQCR